MKRKLSTSVKTTVKVSQRITFVKYVVAGTLFVALLAGGVFFYLNIGTSSQAVAGSKKDSELTPADYSQISFVDLSHLSAIEMELLTNRDFTTDTTRKEYASVKWIVNNSPDFLMLEVANNKSAYSLEIFDQSGLRILNFVNLTEEKFLVEKIDLMPDHLYSYVIKNAAAELYAGSLIFH